MKSTLSNFRFDQRPVYSSVNAEATKISEKVFLQSRFTYRRTSATRAKAIQDHVAKLNHDRMPIAPRGHENKTDTPLRQFSMLPTAGARFEMSFSLLVILRYVERRVSACEPVSIYAGRLRFYKALPSVHVNGYQNARRNTLPFVTKLTCPYGRSRSHTELDTRQKSRPGSSNCGALA